MHSDSLVIGLNYSGKQTTYPCLAYAAYIAEKNPEILEHIYVTDFQTKKILEPKKSYFVLNSKYKSSCSKYPIITFENENRAVEFTKKYDGSIRDFDFAMFVAKKDLSFDAPIIEKRNLQDAKRGKNLFEKYCKNDIKTCKNLNNENQKYLEAYLKNENNIEEKKLSNLTVPQDAKCPVCGMFVAKYPKWASVIAMQDGHFHYFDGVKDMMKFYFEPQKFHHNHLKSDIKSIFVSDYYTLEKISANDAYFVVGSNIFGPMGHELIPFLKLEDAEEFKKSHFGKLVLKFNEINQNIVLELDR